jgi:hypothetical protein
MKTLKIFGLGLCLLSGSVMAQIVVEAETANTLNGTIKVHPAGTGLDGIKAIVPGGDGTYDATATWAEYENISIPTAGDYHFITNTSGFQATSTIEVFVNGTSKGIITVPGTGGWGTYMDSSPLLVTLPAGTIKVKLGFGSTSENTGFLMNIDKFTITTPTTGLNTISSSDVKVLVNKQQNSLTIESEKYQSAVVSIYDITGASIKSANMYNGYTELSTSNFSKGIYMVQIIANGEKFTQKIVL